MGTFSVRLFAITFTLGSLVLIEMPDLRVGDKFSSPPFK